MGDSCEVLNKMNLLVYVDFVVKNHFIHELTGTINYAMYVNEGVRKALFLNYPVRIYLCVHSLICR